MKQRFEPINESVDEIDPMEEANNRFVAESMSKPPLKELGDASVAEETGQFGDAGSSRTVKATPKAMPKAKPAPKAESKPAPKPMPKPAEMPTDVNKLSANERIKQSIEKNLANARSGSGTTDRRSVGERIRSALAGKDRGGNSVDFGGSGMGMKSGGKVSASSRGDGIAQRGKTRGKMC